MFVTFRSSANPPLFRRGLADLAQLLRLP